MALQPKLLKQINGFSTKEDLLAFVSQTYLVLDAINLTTCVYRLARLYTGIRHPEARQAWKEELAEAPAFQLLLRTLQAALCAGVKGVDARCVSNLVWSLVKLDLALGPGCAGYELVMKARPVVLRVLHQSSPQGLANQLYAYAKIQEPPMEVVGALMGRMTEMLARDGHLFDAQVRRRGRGHAFRCGVRAAQCLSPQGPTSGALTATEGSRKASPHPCRARWDGSPHPLSLSRPRPRRP